MASLVYSVRKCAHYMFLASFGCISLLSVIVDCCALSLMACCCDQFVDFELFCCEVEEGVCNFVALSE